MALQTYATPAELADYPVEDAGPSGTAAAMGALLWRASRQVDRVILAATYAVDEDGAATEAAIIEALRLATCEQACYLVATGAENGINPGYHSVQIGSVNLTRGYSSAGSGAEESKFSREAFTILQLAGLTGQAPLSVA